MHFSESAWTYPVVIGLVDVGLWDVIFSILLMLLNLGRSTTAVHGDRRGLHPQQNLGCPGDSHSDQRKHIQTRYSI